MFMIYVDVFCSVYEIATLKKLCTKVILSRISV